MYRKTSDQLPPIGLWLLLGIATMAFFAMVYCFVVCEKEKDFGSRSAYIKERFRMAGDRPVVLLLGTSLSQYGLDSTAAMEAALSGRGRKNPVLIKIWKPATTLEEMVTNMPELKTLHPDLLVVEANMFCYSPQKTFFNQSLRAVYSLLRFEPLHENYFPDQMPADTGFHKGNVGDFRDKVVDTLQLAAFREVACRLTASGTKLVLVNFPVQDVEEKKKWKGPDAVLFNRNFNYLRKGTDFHWYNPSFYLDSTYFADKAHMSRKGYQLYSRWLCSVLDKELHQL